LLCFSAVALYNAAVLLALLLQQEGSGVQAGARHTFARPKLADVTGIAFLCSCQDAC
jgi:hypothetical protein